MNHLRAYIMTSDTGFAPNPYHGILTLATCKPVIRRCTQVGDWIGGWTGVQVTDKDGNALSFSKGQRLIYLARVSEVIKMEDYWIRFPLKRPIEKINSKTSESKHSCGNTVKTVEQPKKVCCGGICATQAEIGVQNCGDNIYEYIDGDWFQHKNPNHSMNFKNHDLSGKNVLLCEEFYYFGVNDGKALDVSQLFGIHITRGGKKLKLTEPYAEQLIDYVRKHADDAAIRGI